jgi:aspartate/methionine/tyrosine aminotransferase
MTEADEIMVARETPPGWHNLAIGEPAFLQEAMNRFFSGTAPVGSAQKTYPPTGGLRSLRERLAERYLGPGPLGPDHIVVANGARQALIAAMVAARTVDGKPTKALAPSPYWPGFPTLARHANLGWWPDIVKSELPHLPFVEIVTWPNNPSGESFALLPSTKPNRAFRIWDAVYASDVYSYNHIKPMGVDVRIGSASKEFGLSGLRVGWAIFKDPDLADIAASYVETTTSGVSLPAQYYLEDTLEWVHKQAPIQYAERIASAKRVLTRNRAALYSVVTRLGCSDMSGTGMFAWLRPENPDQFASDLAEAKILMVDGKYCGSPGYFRANVGVTDATMTAAVLALEDLV